MGRFSWIGNAVIGLLLMGAGGFLLWQEVRVPPSHNVHIYIFASIATLGALIISPESVVTRVGKIVIIISPIIPWSSVARGRRDSTSATRQPD
jgi:hypothetical protein